MDSKKQNIKVFNCNYCGKKFARKNIGMGFCSVRCSNFNGKYIRCLTCDKEFYIPLNQIGKKRYCSKPCSNKSYVKIECGKKMAPLIDHSKPLPQAYKKGNLPWNKGIKNCWSEEILKKIRSARAKQIILNSDTSIELKIKNELDRFNIRYEHPFPLSHFICDFRIKDRNIIIECDGDYFHSLPRNKRCDYLKNKYCKDNDWIIVRLSEKQINNNIDECMSIIMNKIKGVVS